MIKNCFNEYNEPIIKHICAYSECVTKKFDALPVAPALFNRVNHLCWTSCSAHFCSDHTHDLPKPLITRADGENMAKEHVCE